MWCEIHSGQLVIYVVITLKSGASSKQARVSPLPPTISAGYFVCPFTVVLRAYHGQQDSEHWLYLFPFFISELKIRIRREQPNCCWIHEYAENEKGATQLLGSTVVYLFTITGKYVMLSCRIYEL